jgi:hypothetical protein
MEGMRWFRLSRGARLEMWPAGSKWRHRFGANPAIIEDVTMGGLEPISYGAAFPWRVWVRVNGSLELMACSSSSEEAKRLAESMI